MLENYKDSLFNDKIILKSQQTFKSQLHNVYTIEINKIALSSNDDKRLQKLDRVTKYQHQTNVFKVRESELLKVCQAKANAKCSDVKNVKAKCI